MAVGEGVADDVAVVVGEWVGEGDVGASVEETPVGRAVVVEVSEGTALVVRLVDLGVAGGLLPTEVPLAGVRVTGAGRTQR